MAALTPREGIASIEHGSTPVRCLVRAGVTVVCGPWAGIAQLAERELPKLEVAGSNPVARS